MSLTVLTDDQVKTILEDLSLEEAEALRNSLKAALHQYSTGTQAVTDGDIHQPERTSITSGSTGATTLFMPSSSTAGVGMKVITLSPPSTNGKEPAENNVIRPTGAITLYSKTGSPLGFLHATTLTAFRTALASACLLIRRNKVHTITVFGCGEQAYWHVRLALLLRGSTIRHVNIINRRFSDRCKLILKRFYAVPGHIKAREGWADAEFGILTPGYGEYARLLKDQVRAADAIFCCTPSTEPLFDPAILTAHEGRRKGRLIVAIGSYMPRMRELPAELLHQATRGHEKGHHHHFHKHALEGGVVIVDTLDGALKEAGEIIEAGLTPQQLVELGELVMLHRISMAEDESEDASSTSGSIPSAEFEKLDLHLTPGSSAMSSVYGDSTTTDSSSGRKSTSSPTRNGRNRHGSFSFHRRSSSHGSVDRQKKKDDHLAQWLQQGNVIYKSVGLGLMDLTVGLDVVNLAQERGIGTHIEGF